MLSEKASFSTVYIILALVCKEGKVIHRKVDRLYFVHKVFLQMVMLESVRVATFKERNWMGGSQDGKVAFYILFCSFFLTYINYFYLVNRDNLHRGIYWILKA